MREVDRRFGRRVLAVYAAYEGPVTQGVAKVGATCRPGCSACCSQLPITTLPEAVAIAEFVLSLGTAGEEQARTWSQKFLENVARFSDTGLDASLYFEERIVCPFLNEERLCDVYSVRPSSCRHLYVTSDPALCHGGATNEISFVNLGQVHERLLEEAAAACREREVPFLIAPLPVIMPWAFRWAMEGGDLVLAEIRETLTGVMDLVGWTQHLMVLGPEANNVPFRGRRKS